MAVEQHVTRPCDLIEAVSTVYFQGVRLLRRCGTTPRRCTSDVIDGSFAATFTTSETQVYAEDCRLFGIGTRPAVCASWDYLSPLARDWA